LLAALPAFGFDLQGHRGARGLAPENTLDGFAAALRVGVHTLELDLVMSADGVLMVSHDLQLNPLITRDAAGRWLVAPTPALNTLTREQLRSYDVGRIQPGSRYAQTFAGQQPVDGERMPTLDALFEHCRRWGADAVRFNLEIKTNPHRAGLTPEPALLADALLASLQRHGLMQRASVQSFDWRSLMRLRERAPALPTVALTAQQSWLNNVADPSWTAGLKLADHDGSVPRLVHATGARTWSPHHADLSVEALLEAQALGLRVVVWTVNEPAQIDRLLAMGVDGIISDYPDRVRDAMARRGMALPPALDVPR
jgi:glycerophosphoryl diester phosphodiesterase